MNCSRHASTRSVGVGEGKIRCRGQWPRDSLDDEPIIAHRGGEAIALAPTLTEQHLMRRR